MRAFAADDQVLPLVELVRRTGLHKATVHRVAGDLVTNRLLDRTANGYRRSLGTLGEQPRDIFGCSGFHLPSRREMQENGFSSIGHIRKKRTMSIISTVDRRQATGRRRGSTTTTTGTWFPFREHLVLALDSDTTAAWEDMRRGIGLYIGFRCYGFVSLTAVAAPRPIGGNRRAV